MSAVAADLNHLRPAIQRAVLRGRMAGARDGAADAHCAGELGLERVGDIVLPQIAGTPTGRIEKTIVHREVDIGDERRHRLEPLEDWRKLVWIGRLGRDLDDLSDRPFVAVAVPDPDRRGKVLETYDAVDKA